MAAISELETAVTIEEAEKKGYEIVIASPFEVGLLKNGRGIRTWFGLDFGCKVPTLDHPTIQQAIEATERWYCEPV